MSNIALIVAAGNSVRFGGDLPKQFVEIAGRPLLAWTISRFEQATSIDQIILVVAEDWMAFAQEQIVDRFHLNKVSKIVSGGETRQQSVRKGLDAASKSARLVAIHDGARPLVMPEDIDNAVAAARKSDAAMLAMPATDTLKRVENGLVVATLRRESVCQAQTPQVFDADLIRKAHAETADTGATDDAALVESLGVKVAVVVPTGPNPKVTTKIDFKIAEILLTEGSSG